MDSFAFCRVTRTGVSLVTEGESGGAGAVGVQLLPGQGIAVPNTLKVIGVDKDKVLCELSNLALSSVILNAQQIGYEAAALFPRY